MNPYQVLRKLVSSAISGALLLGGAVPFAQACTGIRIVAEDGTVVRGRTMEFAIDVHSDVIWFHAVMRGLELRLTARKGLKWKAKYASLGANGVGLPYLFDGLNEKGLAVGTFYFPGTAGYMPYQASAAGKSIAEWQVGSWMLGELRHRRRGGQSIASIVVPSVVLPAWGFAPPFHYVVYDASGKSMVVEYVGGKLHVYDNPLGVITNSRLSIGT